MPNFISRLIRIIDTFAGAVVGMIIFPIISVIVGTCVWLGLALIASAKLLNIPYQFIKTFFQEDGMSWQKAAQLSLMLTVGMIELASLYFLWPVAQFLLEAEATWNKPFKGIYLGLTRGLSGLLRNGIALEQTSWFYSFASHTGLFEPTHLNLYARLLNWLSLHLLNRPINRELLPLNHLIEAAPILDAHPLFEALQIIGEPAATERLSAEEIRLARLEPELAPDLAQYLSLNARLVEIARLNILPEAQKPRDELTAAAITRPILLFKEVQIEEGVWQPLRGTSNITDHHHITQYLLHSNNHPLNHDDIFNPEQHEGQLTRYRWQNFVGFSAELENLKSRIRQRIPAADAAIIREPLEQARGQALHFFEAAPERINAEPALADVFARP